MGGKANPHPAKTLFIHVNNSTWNTHKQTMSFRPERSEVEKSASSPPTAHATLDKPLSPKAHRCQPAKPKSQPKVRLSKTLQSFDRGGGPPPPQDDILKSMRIASLQPSITITLA